MKKPARMTTSMVAAAFVIVAAVYLATAVSSGSFRHPLAGLGLTDARDPHVSRLEHQFDRHVRPILERNCFACHGQQKQKGELALHSFDSLAAIQRDRITWQRVSLMLHQRLMPPERRTQRPTSEEYDLAAAWIDDALAYVDCCGPRDAGRVTIRRLNRAEYNNTIRDLVDVDVKPADDFPVDDSGYGFDHIGDVLTTSTLLAEKYLASAERVMNVAIVTAKVPKPAIQRYTGRSMAATVGGPGPGQSWGLWSKGDLHKQHHFPADGQYVVRVQAWGQQAGDEVARMAVKLGNTTLAEFKVPAVQDEPSVYETRFNAQAGRQRIAAAFLNDYYKPDDPDESQRDRNLFVQYVEIDGPYNVAPPHLTESHKRIVFVTPDEHLSPPAAARKIIRRFANRAFRRRITDDELANLLTLFEIEYEQHEDFETAVQYALTGVLVSPHFLFRAELPPGDEPPNDIKNANETAPTVTYAIDDWSLASRLSYFLWNSMPDEQLFKLADDGQLRRHHVRAEQAVRMLAHPRASDFINNFVGQWLELRKIDQVTPDPQRFATFDGELRNAMRREGELVFETIVREDRSILELLDADWTFANARLAKHYGLDHIESDTRDEIADADGMRRISLAGTSRGGVMTMAAVLTLTSNPTRTSPVKRGKWVLENVLGAAPPPPPPQVPELTESSAESAATLREQMEQHRANPNCASCHARMDALGFALENFDAVGRWRDRDGGQVVDASGNLPDGRIVEGPAGLKSVLMAEKEQFVRCFVEKMLIYALGRGLEHYDHCTVLDICERVRKHQYRFSSVVLAIIDSEPFLNRRRAGAEP